MVFRDFQIPEWGTTIPVDKMFRWGYVIPFAFLQHLYSGENCDSLYYRLMKTGIIILLFLFVFVIFIIEKNFSLSHC